MALLLQKKHIINSNGEEELLSIYTTKEEACDAGKPCRIINIRLDDQDIVGYIGYTDELDTPKISSKRILIDGKEYGERKYMGVKDMDWYMKTNYPGTYKTLTQITEDMIPIDTTDCTSFQYAFKECTSSKSFPKIDTSKATNLYEMYCFCESGLEFPEIDTSKCTSFRGLYWNCKQAIKISEIDFSMAQDKNLKGISAIYMFGEAPMLRSITFNNLPPGTTEETLRNVCGIPSTVTEIIMNYRSE